MNPSSVYQHLATYQSVLDVGTGHGAVLRGVLKYGRPRRLVGVDAYAPAVAKARQLCHAASFRQMDIRHLSIAFGARSFDAAVGFDIVEHLVRADAVKVLESCERIASQVVWWFVPIGDHPQMYDPRHEGNEDLQRHRSTWQPQDFADRGYTTWYYPDWHQKSRHTDKCTGAAFCRRFAHDTHGVVITQQRFGAKHAR